VAWNWADEFAFDFVAVLWFGDHWASFRWAHARAAWAAHRADERRRASDANHCQLWLLLLLGMVWADGAVHMFAAFRSFRFRASLGDLFAGAAWARLRADDFHFHGHGLLLLFGVVRLADRAEANKCTACRSFRFRASFGDFLARAAWKGRRTVGRHGDFHHWFRLLFGVVRWANWAVADKFATFGPFRYWASFRDFLAGAAWKSRRAAGRHGDFHHWLRLLLLLGMVRWADWTMADTFATFWSFRFRASFRDFLAGTAWKGRWAGSIGLDRGFSEFHFDVFDADVWADERAFEQFAMVGSLNWRTAFWHAFARTTWARRRANLLLEG